jgi:hypothetical protein
MRSVRVHAPASLMWRSFLRLKEKLRAHELNPLKVKADRK